MKTETNGAAAVLAAFWGLVCAYCVKIMVPLLVLLCVMLLDYVTGMAKAWHRGELSSRVGVRGILKKLGYVVTVAVAGVMDWLIGYGLAQAGIDIHLPFLLGMIVTCWLIINELISILENVAAMDGPVPPWLGRILNKLKQTVDDKVEPEDKPVVLPDDKEDADHEAG